MTNPLLKKWFPNLDEKLIIAGPCSAESKDQVLNTAKDLSKLKNISIFRAGVWKPRTRPNAFEGHGEEALSWLKEVQDKYKLPAAVEIATPEHLNLGLKNGLKIFWIGARTTAGPFAVQQLADALKGQKDIIVMVKNPVNAELPLWIGAIERFHKAGIEKIMAIHRGFAGQENTVYRNIPLWNQPMELKRLFPNLPIICDPSHIAGKRDLIKSICQTAWDLDLDGLMIETHPDPDKALSDSLQQITPTDLKVLLENLILKSPQVLDKNFESKLEYWRGQIDRLDDEIMEFLKKRMDVCQEIGIEKAKHNITVLQADRMDWLLGQWKKKGLQIGLSSDFTKKLFHIIHEESVRIQTEQQANKDEENK